MSRLTYCVLFIVIGVSTFAQDILVRKDGSIIKGKVVEIGEEKVSYLNPKSQSPIHSIPVSELTSINFENGKIERFSSGQAASSGTSRGAGDGKTQSADRVEALKKRIVIIAREAGDKIVESCSNFQVKPDNYSTEVYWDTVSGLESTGEITVPIITKWVSAYTGDDGDWIKGKLIISQNSSEVRWVFQSRSDPNFDCGEILGFH
jgi:hypothetical protein